MSSLLAAASHAAAVAASSGDNSFDSPGPGDFDFPGFFGISWFTKPILIVLLATLVLMAFYLASARNAKIVPGKMQFAGESVYGFVRNSLALDAIGPEGLKFAPYLATLFSFVALNNFAGVIPILQIPSTSHIAFPAVLAVASWIIFLVVGIRHHGFKKYFGDMLFPPGIPLPVYFLLSPIEFFSTVIVRPITLALRLTFNMFAGHLVLLLFVLGGQYLLSTYGGPVGIGAGTISILASIILTLFEAFIQILQAYVFTLLSALYIGGALADEH